MLELTTIWKDKSHTQQVESKADENLGLDSYDVWGCRLDTQKKYEKKIRGAEMWFYRRLLLVSWAQKRTNRSILEIVYNYWN